MTGRSERLEDFGAIDQDAAATMRAPKLSLSDILGHLNEDVSPIGADFDADAENTELGKSSLTSSLDIAIVRMGDLSPKNSSISEIRNDIAMRVTRSLRVRADELAARAFAHSVACNYAIEDVFPELYVDGMDLSASPRFADAEPDAVTALADWRTGDEILVNFEGAPLEAEAAEEDASAPHETRWTPGEPAPSVCVGDGSDVFRLCADPDEDRLIVLVEDGATFTLRTGEAVTLEAAVVSISSEPWTDIDAMRWTKSAELTGFSRLVVEQGHSARTVIVMGDFAPCDLKPTAIALEPPPAAPIAADEAEWEEEDLVEIL